MKNKIMKILGVVMTVAMLGSFMVAGAPVSAAGSAPSVNDWSSVTMPNLMPDTDVELIEQAVDDGTIFISVYFEESTTIKTDVGNKVMTAETWAMFKSTDGYNWELTNIYNQPHITAIEPSANYKNDKVVYVAVESLGAYTTLYRCTDGADIKTNKGEMGQISAGQGGNLVATEIYDLDSYYDGSYVWLLAATDIDAFAIRDDRGLTTIWTDMQLSETLGGADYSDATGTGVEVYKAKFAKDYAQSGVIWAVYYDNVGFEPAALVDRGLADVFGTDGYGIIARSSGSTLWGTKITPIVLGPEDDGIATAYCDFEFSTNYNSDDNPEIYLAVGFDEADGSNGVWRFEIGFYGDAGERTAFDAGEDDIGFCSLEVNGTNLIAGAYDEINGAGESTQVWFSTNSGTTWNQADIDPTGELNWTCNILISKYGATKGLAFAATGGAQSAISISEAEDKGNIWAQTAFIDDVIDSVIGIAFNPTNTIALLVTENDDDNQSVWVTDNVNSKTVKWKRILCTGYNSNTINEFEKFDFAADGSAFMVLNDGVIYSSTDGGKHYSKLKSIPSWGNIEAWIIPNASTVYAATDEGFWTTTLVSNRLADKDLVSIAKSGNSIVVGDNAGKAYVSTDGGINFGAAIACGDAMDNVFVAFDANTNGVFYYATDKGKVGVVTLDGNKVKETGTGNNVELKDNGGKGVVANLGSATAIIVAPDNALYVAGATKAGGTTISAAGIAGGTLDFTGSDSSAFADPSVDIETSPYLVMGDLITLFGTFDAGEDLSMYAADVVADSSTIISGKIYVEGDDSGAMGYFEFTYYGGFDGFLIKGENIEVEVDGLVVGESTSSSGADSVECMQRLLLGQSDNNWEGPVTNKAGMNGLQYTAGSNILWTVVETQLYAFEDFLSGKTQGVKAVEVDVDYTSVTKTVEVSWTHMNEDGDTVYLVSYQKTGTNTSAAFATYNVKSTVDVGSTVKTKISGLDASAEYTFKVRVANDSPIQSRWSDGVKVTTSAYVTAPNPVSPLQAQPQSATASLHPTFTWSTGGGAAKYEFQLSDSASFANIIDTVVVAETGYTYNGDGLAYDTDYYWRVRSVAADGVGISAWATYNNNGAPCAFHTMVDPDAYKAELTVTQTETKIELTVTENNPTYTIPVPEFTVTVPVTNPPATTVTNVVEIPEQSTPAYIWAIVAIGALLTIAVIVLIIRTRRVV
ncbi:MAG: fibronectin type III domain-containing protein [Dehalococcoidales bacterium]